jgi:hypothetical protein
MARSYIKRHFKTNSTANIKSRLQFYPSNPDMKKKHGSILEVKSGNSLPKCLGCGYRCKDCECQNTKSGSKDRYHYTYLD